MEAMAPVPARVVRAWARRMTVFAASLRVSAPAV